MVPKVAIGNENMIQRISVRETHVPKLMKDFVSLNISANVQYPMCTDVIVFRLEILAYQDLKIQPF